MRHKTPVDNTLAPPHCVHCGAAAPDGIAGLGQDATGGYVLLISCESCGDVQPAAGDDTHCTICGDPTRGAGPLEGILFAGRPVELVSCLDCYARVVREEPALGWLEGLALEVVAVPS